MRDIPNYDFINVGKKRTIDEYREDLNNAQMFIAIMLRNVGGRMEIPQSTIQTFDPTGLFLNMWKEHVSGRYVISLTDRPETIFRR